MYSNSEVARSNWSHSKMMMWSILFAFIVIVGFHAIPLSECFENCNGYINGSQVNLTGNDFAVKVILVDIGTNVTFYSRDAHCEKEVPSENNHWHAGKKRLININSYSDPLFQLFSISNFTQPDGCISFSLTVTVNGTLLQPPGYYNVIYSTDNSSHLKWICSPGYSLAEYFVLLIKDSDTCPPKATSSCDERSIASSGLTTTSNGVKTYSNTATSLPSSVILPSDVSGSNALTTSSPTNNTASTVITQFDKRVSKVVMVTVPVLTMTVVIFMVTITIIGLYFIWRRRRRREGNAPETIYTSNNDKGSVCQ